MKKHAVIAAALCWAVSMPAYAQLSGITKRINQAADAKDKYDDWKMSES